MKCNQCDEGGFEHIVIKRAPELRHEKRSETLFFHQFELVAHAVLSVVISLSRLLQLFVDGLDYIVPIEHSRSISPC